MAGALAAASGPRSPAVRLGASQTARADTAQLDPPARAEHVPSRASADPPVPDPVAHVVLLDEDVLRALGQKQPSFMRCFRIAQRDDIMLVTARVSLHVKVGPTGTIDEAIADGGTPALDACIVAVARHLSFGAPARPVEADLKLFFAQ